MMTPKTCLIASAASLLLAGCTGMNTDFSVNQPAQDTGMWMQQADDLAAAGQSHRINLNDYRLMAIGGLPLLPPQVGTEPPWQGTPRCVPGASWPVLADGPLRPATRVNGTRRPGYDGRWWPEPTTPGAPSRRPDDVIRIWIAPYVSPDNSVHMNEVIFTVARPADWNSLLK